MLSEHTRAERLQDFALYLLALFLIYAAIFVVIVHGVLRRVPLLFIIFRRVMGRT